jgi:5-methylcytosine-specific restriction protein A
MKLAQIAEERGEKMPVRPKKPCRKHGCKELVELGYCDKHKKESYKRDERRGTASERGYGSEWRKARLGFLSRNPLCKECLKNDIIEPATDVDHVIPHRGDRKLFWDVNNWQALCHICHSKKTARGE